jgi:hypothetical protein
VTNAQERNGVQKSSMERMLKRLGRKTGSPWTGCRRVLGENLGRCNCQVSGRSTKCAYRIRSRNEFVQEQSQFSERHNAIDRDNIADRLPDDRDTVGDLVKVQARGGAAGTTVEMRRRELNLVRYARRTGNGRGNGSQNVTTFRFGSLGRAAGSPLRLLHKFECCSRNAFLITNRERPGSARDQQTDTWISVRGARITYLVKVLTTLSPKSVVFFAAMLFRR